MNLRRRLPLLYGIVILGAVGAILSCSPLPSSPRAASESSAGRTVATAAPVAPLKVDLLSGFSIVEWHMDAPNSIGSVYVRGEVLNGNSEAAGVELEVVSRDAAGRIVDSTTFWPASTRNIPAKGSAPIAYPATRNSAATKFGLRIVRARVW